MLKVSFVTTCMNRAYSIKKTLIHNIKNSARYLDRVEFVLLNYDSKDDLDDYIKKECMQYIDWGILKYYKLTESEEYFHMARAKNIVYKVANNELIHNVDAEWLIYPPIFKLIFNEFKTGDEQKILHIGGYGGGIVNYKKHFLQVNGYDERMFGWGRDDSDFFNRLRYGYEFNLKKVPFHPYAKNITTKLKARDKNLPQECKTDNDKIAKNNIQLKNWIVNQDYPWGKANLLLNFSQNIII
jgi:hypothetical protein